MESAGYLPQMAVDGDSGTRWSSGQWMQPTSTGWISVDLGASYNISEVRLNWETAYAVDYQIQTSADAQSWTTIKSVAGNASKGIVDFSGLSGTGRYVRIYCTQTSAGSDNYSLYDLQVYGTPTGSISLLLAGSLISSPDSAVTSAAPSTAQATSTVATAGSLPGLVTQPATKSSRRHATFPLRAASLPAHGSRPHVLRHHPSFLVRQGLRTPRLHPHQAGAGKTS